MSHSKAVHKGDKSLNSLPPKSLAARHAQASVATRAIGQRGDTTAAGTTPAKAPYASSQTTQQAVKAVIDPAPLAPTATSCSGAVVYNDVVGTRVSAGLRLHPLLLRLRLQAKHNKKVLR